MKLVGMVSVVRENHGEELRGTKGRALRENVSKQRENKKTNREAKEKGKTRTHKYVNPRSQTQ